MTILLHGKTVQIKTFDLKEGWAIARKATVQGGVSVNLLGEGVHCPSVYDLNDSTVSLMTDILLAGLELEGSTEDRKHWIESLNLLEAMNAVTAVCNFNAAFMKGKVDTFDLAQPDCT